MRIISGKARGTKLYTLEGNNTRPTLDRVKESLFNIIQSKLEGKVFLDLFSGSGAVGLEAVSRNARKAILCDNNKEAISIIKKNASKTHLEELVDIYNTTFEKLIKNILDEKIDIIYIDPPYATNYTIEAIELLIKYDLIADDGIVILETDDEQKIMKLLQNINIKIINKRKYGRAHLIFLQKN